MSRDDEIIIIGNENEQNICWNCKKPVAQGHEVLWQSLQNRNGYYLHHKDCVARAVRGEKIMNREKKKDEDDGCFGNGCLIGWIFGWFAGNSNNSDC